MKNQAQKPRRFDTYQKELFVLAVHPLFLVISGEELPILVPSDLVYIGY